MIRVFRPSSVTFVLTLVLLSLASSGCWWGRGPDRRGYRHEEHREYRR